MNAACTFWNTVSLGKMLIRWKDRPTRSGQTWWGGRPVMSRPSRSTAPASGRRWPVTRLKSVVLPAPFGPMIAAISPRATARLTPATAWKPAKALWTPRPSSPPEPREAPAAGVERADDAAGKREQEHDQDRAEHERPVLGVGRDLLVQHEQHERADGGAVEVAHAAEDRHDQALRGLRPVDEVGEHAAVEDPEERAREARERPREHEGEQLPAPDVHADELRALGVLPDRREDAAERRADDAAEEPEAQGHHYHREQVEVVAGAQVADD